MSWDDALHAAVKWYIMTGRRFRIRGYRTTEGKWLYMVFFWRTGA